MGVLWEKSLGCDPVCGIFSAEPMETFIEEEESSHWQSFPLHFFPGTLQEGLNTQGENWLFLGGLGKNERPDCSVFNLPALGRWQQLQNGKQVGENY